MNSKLSLKKGTTYGTCKHIAAVAQGDTELDEEHWYYFPRSPRRKQDYEWASVCGTCFAKAERSPQAQLPITHLGVLSEDVEISQGEAN
jgi:hypothetical protein